MTSTETALEPQKPALDPKEIEMMRQNLLRKIGVARTRLLCDYPFFGSLVMRLTILASDDEKTPTASIDPTGLLRFGLTFGNQLSEAELAGVLCHEVLHAALFYWARKGPRNVILRTKSGGEISAWNVAHDYAINLIIEEATKNQRKPWVALPPNCLLDKKYTGWTAEDIYEDILKNTPEMDAQADVDEGSNSDPVQEDSWRRAILQAAQSQTSRGMSLPDALKILVEDIAKPKVDWRDQLSQWAGDNIGLPDYSYRRPSRREEAAGEILAAQIESDAPEVIVLWDTSGSMSGRENSVLGEVIGILECSKAPIRVILCDAMVRGDLTDTRDVAEIAASVVGGGGSDFCPAFTLIENTNTNGSAVIIAITDGEIGVPAVMPFVQAVLWVIPEKGPDPTGGKWGSVVRIPLQDLK